MHEQPPLASDQATLAALYPPRPFDISVGRLPPATAETLTAAVYGCHLDGYLKFGELWVSRAEALQFAAGYRVTDSDGLPLDLPLSCAIDHDDLSWPDGWQDGRPDLIA